MWLGKIVAQKGIQNVIYTAPVWVISKNKVLSLPLVPKGVPWNPPENHFPTRILQWNLHHIYMDYNKLNFCKKKFNSCTVSKWRPNNRFSFCVISILTKIWKTTFPKVFFNEMWLKVGEHEKIYISEIKFRKKLFHFKMAAKTIFWYCVIILIYANLRENDGIDLNFLASK